MHSCYSSKFHSRLQVFFPLYHSQALFHRLVLFLLFLILIGKQTLIVFIVLIPEVSLRRGDGEVEHAHPNDPVHGWAQAGLHDAEAKGNDHHLGFPTIIIVNT